jgi:peroxiredoxin
VGLEVFASDQHDVAGGSVTSIGQTEVAEIQRLLQSASVELELDRRYSVVFFYPGIGVGIDYPELAGCTSEICTFADQTTEFVKHGIQLAGMSMRETKPPGEFLTTFPFPVGKLPADVESPLLALVHKGDERFVSRTSFIVFPDATGVRISDIHDPVTHVHTCFDVAISRRLASYQTSTLKYLQNRGDSIRASMLHKEFLSNGADSVSISTIDFRAEVVAKMADAAIVAQEAGYMDRINSVLEENGRPKLFPRVISIETDERPAYYLMEAANPLSLDHLLFDDESMTKLRADRLHILTDSLKKLSNLYEVTFRAEVPKVMRYHYLDRFLAIPERRDFIDTFEFMFQDAATMEAILNSPVRVDDFACRSFEDQMRFLEKEIDSLLQPTGAYLHGDVHMKNMLVQEDGRSVVFIDPRIVWDGFDVGDPGFADPLYDFGTLLHSIHFTSAILQAIESAQTESLLEWSPPSGSGEGIEVTTRVLPIKRGSTVTWFTDWLQREVPSEVLGNNWKARLHVNTANAAFGWLKYARAVQTPHAWMSLFISTLFHLEMARRHLEGGDVAT